MTNDQRHRSETEQLQQRNRELSILNAIAEALNREVNLTHALQTTLMRLTELFQLQTGWVWLQHETTGVPYLAAALNLPPSLRANPAIMDGAEECYCLEKYQLGDLEGAANIGIITCTRLKSHVNSADGLRYHASIPLYHHDRKVGILNVAAADWRRLSSDDLRLLSTVGDLLSIAIERAQLFTRSAAQGATEERNRLAREIHDTLAQGLAGIALQLETADALLESGTNPERAAQAVRQALVLARANLEEARRSVLDLRAAPLQGRTFGDALESLMHEAAVQGALQPVFRMASAGSLPVRVEVMLYRIAQEALTNIVRHAQAREVSLDVSITPEAVDLIIEDDGRGFDPAQIGEGRFGLVGLNERTHLLGGTLRICSVPDEGTRIHVHIPLKAIS